MRYELPRVMEDGSLLFIERIPLALPYFRKEGDRFYPDFPNCRFRNLKEVPASTAPG